MSRIDDIRRDYELRKARAKDEVERSQLELQEERAVSAALQDEIREEKRNSVVAAAIAKYPRAIRSELIGDTGEQIELSAKTSHERIQSEIDKAVAIEKERLAAEAGDLDQQWGGGVGASGGRGRPPSQLSDEDKVIQEGWKGLRQGTLTRQQGEQLRKLRMTNQMNRVAGNMEPGKSEARNKKSGRAVIEGEPRG